jgi:acyl-CoA thioesterase-1
MLRRGCVQGECHSRYRPFTRVLKQWIALGLLTFAGVSPVAAADPIRLMVLGDSLTAGYGLPEKEAFPVKLEAALRQSGISAVVINAGVSGDTTAGGLARIGWALADRPTHVLVELGANDALRGIDPKTTRGNLDAIVAKLQAAGVKVMLAGMYAPPNWGKEYETDFRSIYPDLARKYGVGLYPFFLDGVAARRELNQPDGIHPNEKGVAIIVERILPPVRQFLGAKE